MRRRTFIKSVCGAAGTLMWTRPAEVFAQQPPKVTPDPEVKRVLAMFKCHLDVGFTNTQAAVIRRYFDQYYPQAMQTARDLRQNGARQYVWTTGSWLLYEYLEQASPENRKRMEQAVADGDIAWHALPFSWQTELLDQSMIAGSLALSEALDRRFGRKTTGAKMTDVPGHTRGLIAPLAAHGVTFLDIGVNGGSRTAELPPLFVWTDHGGAGIVVMYHHEYGSIQRVPGSDFAVAIVMGNDNGGPHSKKEITKVYSDLKQQFPNAQVLPGSLSDIANAVWPQRERLPVVTQEIGDTWIHGIASDPLKVARYREVVRLRRDWIAQGSLHPGDAMDVALLRRLLLEVEHTWGTDTKRYLDYDHYKPRDLAAMLPTKNYKVLEFSWQEKRKDLFESLETLPAALRTQAQTAVQNLAAVEPASAGADHDAGQDIEGAHLVVGLDANGAIRRLRNKSSGKEWASPDHRLALFSYQSLGPGDYSRFFNSYIISNADWVPKDFGKPNMEKFGARSQVWQPSLASLKVEENAEQHRALAQLEIRDAEALESGRAAYPRRMFLEIVLPKSEPVLLLNFYWFQKAATRLPEALWLSFRPITASAQGWTMDKCGEEISPLDIISSGGRHMHSVDTAIRYREQPNEFVVEPLDAPLFALGEMSPLNFSRSQPDLSAGIHCSLFNNAWGTNYIQWFGEDMRFRFVIRA